MREMAEASDKMGLREILGEAIEAGESPSRREEARKRGSLSVEEARAKISEASKGKLKTDPPAAPPRERSWLQSITDFSWMAPHADFVSFAGVLTSAAGVWLIYPPASLIIFGMVVAWFGWKMGKAAE